MQSSTKTVDQYINELPEDRKACITKLRNIVLKNLPEGYQETMSYGMIGYVVPHSIYPNGYHCDTKLPLPFMSIASQKGHIGFYHMGIYADEKLLNWFQEEYPNHSKLKLNMGKSCIRFKKPDHITYDLIGELVSKMSVQNWIDLYEKNVMS